MYFSNSISSGFKNLIVTNPYGMVYGGNITITILTLLGNFFLGVKDGADSAATDLVDIITNPSKIAEGVEFLLQCLTSEEERAQVLKLVADSIVDTISKLANSDGNTRARMVGKFVGEVIVGLIADKAVIDVLKYLKEGFLIKINNKLLNGEDLGGYKTYADDIAEWACFTPGMLVLTKDGLKPIEEIKIGDYVWSENPITHEKGLKKVVNTFVHNKNKLVNIYLGNTLIETTETHPFWIEGIEGIEGKGWIAAGDIKAGDILRLQPGENIAVSKIEIINLDSIVKVYNFEVEDWHTYYVSGDGVLVHNMCTAGAVENILRILNGNDITDIIKYAKQINKFDDYFEIVMNDGQIVKIMKSELPVDNINKIDNIADGALKGFGEIAGNSYDVTSSGISKIKSHLATLDTDSANDLMIERLESALASGQKLEGADASFYLHELKESDLMASGINYNAAHEAALEHYGVSRFSVYHPDVIKALLSEFNDFWKRFWGLI